MFFHLGFVSFQLANLGWTFSAGPDQGFPFKELDLNPAAVYTKKLGCLSGSGVNVGTSLAKKSVEKQCNWIIRKISSYLGMILF